MPQTLDTSGTVLDARGFASDDKYLAVLNRILHIHQANNMHLLCDLSGVVFQIVSICSSVRSSRTE